MRLFLLKSLLEVRRSYWFWPSLLVALAVIAGFALPILDRALGSGWVEGILFLKAMQPDAARDMLTTLGAAVLGVAGVAFSITIVAVSFASGNYGPRLIGNFMSDRINQVVLGVFLATFVFCVTVLRTVHGASPAQDGLAAIDAFVPQLSVLCAMVMSLGAVAALIVFIHHVPETINIMNLAADVGGKLRRTVVAMLDDGAEHSVQPFGAYDRSASVDRALRGFDGATTVTATAAGYIQRYDLDGLAKTARKNDLTIMLTRAAGDFVVSEEAVMAVRPAERVTDAIGEELRQSFSLGASRTGVQDALFLTDQLVEMVGRALSPGVNDPHTAIICIDWLYSALVEFARRAPAQPSRDGALLFDTITFEAMLHRAFGRMRQYVTADRTVTLHALQVLGQLMEATDSRSRAATVRETMETYAESARDQLDESAALEEIERALLAGRDSFSSAA